MKNTISRRTTLAALAASAVALPGLSLAQADRPVKFILPNATGSGVDAITRAAAPALGKALGTNVVVENQAGASGVIGLQALAKNPPDGYTLSVVSNNVVIFPSVIKNLPFEMPGDFTPIAVVGATPLVLVANPQRVPANNGREFIAALKAKPDGFNFGSGGTGTILHLAAEMFVDEAGIKARHIPYKGVGPMVTDLLGGQIDFAVVALPSVQQHIKSGALKAVGMCGEKRNAAAPDIPTFVEQGLPRYVIDAWFGVLGPKGMSAAAVKKVHDALVAAFNDPAVKDTMTKQGNTIAISSVEQAQKAFRSEMERFAALVKKVGIEPQ
ncbi:tripartite tricarboxylate transporter substrate binding protein [Limnohabitans sp. Hippo3]|uniref:Bug family tripartite tricarboxylate transporter substrate binding protein n=1 Tax=Limnohabitans sp. Hippo3 TaxID=1597956 RepID=UPI000D38E993|nr:tripartite tricarboxylate transporter substrate binding protein [Limnohabitans sp. Hippo3]PUE38933.1 ABC transporter substrate-binding protein [Limnohabitans sp. Hippo3]